ncbi:ganglioside GM2 activator isoform X3 [Hyalella azteca]|uniref:Ganglioside GM2 activator isoform X3 n=1 Tax=Hyalella azteca TaxID=294128 RepID=A0A8B7NBD8_HYAAZ|nr:ganglioside GM2 activator isoform X3 [Hyalella azteca]
MASFVFTRGDDIFIAKVQVESCGGDNQTIQVNKLQWSPASVNFDSPLTFNFSATVSDVISAPVQVSVKVERHVWLMWVPVPCVDGVGSCTYDDVCSYTPSPSCAVLPHNLHLPCSCPVMPDKYFVDDGEVELPGSDAIPEWATHGWYRATVTVRSPEQDKQLACYKAKIHLG